jgi:hypothetical protein
MLYPRRQKPLRYSSEIYFGKAMSNAADVTGGKPIVVWSQTISGVKAIISLVGFYDIYGKKREAILLFCPGHDTRKDVILYHVWPS